MKPRELSDNQARLFGAYIYQHSGGHPIGRDGRIRVSYYLDLMSAATNERQLNDLTALLEGGITRDPNLATIEAIAAPKRGNALLGYRLARKLDKTFLLVKDSVLFARWIEGMVHPRQRVLLVDDVASDGDLLQDSVKALRTEGAIVGPVWVIAHRKEGDAGKTLAALDIEYHAVFEFDDDDLARIQKRARALA